MSNLTKEKVIIFTSKYRIEGVIYIEEGFRLVDYLNREKDAKRGGDFFPVVEGVVYDSEGNEIFRSKFLCVNKQQVLFATGGE